MLGICSRLFTGSLWATLSGSGWATLDTRNARTCRRIAIFGRYVNTILREPLGLRYNSLG